MATWEAAHDAVNKVFLRMMGNDAPPEKWFQKAAKTAIARGQDYRTPLAYKMATHTALAPTYQASDEYKTWVPVNKIVREGYRTATAIALKRANTTPTPTHQ